MSEKESRKDLHADQESVLGPLLFSSYTGELERIVMKYKPGFH